MTEKESMTEKKAKPAKGKVALKDFHLFHPPHSDIMINKGDKLDDIPEMYHNNLIIEGVMKGK